MFGKNRTLQIIDQYHLRSIRRHQRLRIIVDTRQIGSPLPLLVRPRSRHRKGRLDQQHRPPQPPTRSRLNQLAPPSTPRRPPMQKKWHIRTHPGRHRRPYLIRIRQPQQLTHPTQRRRRITAAPPPPRPRRKKQPFFPSSKNPPAPTAPSMSRVHEIHPPAGAKYAARD